MEKGWRQLFTELLEAIPWFITDEIVEELHHFHPKSIETWGNGPVLKRLDKKFSDYVADGFDKADASLLEYGDQEGYVVVTEDPRMLAQNVFERSNIIQLCDLLKEYHSREFLSAKEYKEIIVWLRKNRNLTERKIRRLLAT